MTVPAEESAGKTLLVVVLKEIEHMFDSLVSVLHPLIGDTIGTPAFAHHAAQVVVHPHFVVEVVKACRQIGVVLTRVVTLTDEDELLVFLLHLRDCPLEELHRHHLCHINPYAVDTFSSPEEQYIAHLDPCVGDRIELLLSASLIVHAVVQFDRLVPIVQPRVRGEAVVSGHFRRILVVALQILIHREAFTRQIIEIIQRRESPFGMIGLA